MKPTFLISVSNGFGVQLRAKRVRCNAWLCSNIYRPNNSTTTIEHTKIESNPPFTDCRDLGESLLNHVVSFTMPA